MSITYTANNLISTFTSIAFIPLNDVFNQQNFILSLLVTENIVWVNHLFLVSLKSMVLRNLQKIFAIRKEVQKQTINPISEAN